MTEGQRLYKRHALSYEEAPKELQHDGYAVKLHWPWILEWFGCSAIMKDVSLGGCGVLVPIEKNVPKRVMVQLNDETRLKAIVVYRKEVSPKLMFLGIDWGNESEANRHEAVRIVAASMPDVTIR
ncbi:PilZ domain-containing protein [Shewanella sp. A25]|nr:PilZ domain-containing protein [Shewanella shenzhenensis]